MWLKVNIVLFIFGINYVDCSDVYLVCDEFGMESLESFCTVSNFYLKHDDTVLYDPAYSQGSRDYYFIIEVLKFTESKMPCIPENLFYRMSNLREFDISFTGVELLHRNEFENANNLIFFTSIHNKIASLTPSVFRNAPNISVIDLSHNLIEELKENSFIGSERISRLHFSHNRIKNIAWNAFATLFQMDTIDLSHNLLESIDPKLFADSGLLQTINLNNNRLMRFECAIFGSLVYLVNINLSENRLQQFNSSCLNQNRLDINISGNNMSQITLFDASVFNAANNRINEVIIPENVTFSMRELNLGGNNITSFHQIFDRFATLEYLDLSNSKIGPLNITTFSKLRGLKKLYLRNCSLSNITFGTFSSQKDLLTLDISYNNLNRINFNVFIPYLQHLTELYIDGNNLTELNGLSREMFVDLTTLGLSHNRFQCSDIIRTIMDFNLAKLELTVDINETIINQTHVNGIACEHYGQSDTDWSNYNIRGVNDHHSTRPIVQQINQSAVRQILEWQHRYNVLQFQEQTHQFYLNFIKYLIASISIVCLAIVLYKFAIFYQKQRRTHIVLHEGFYRSAATLNSTHTDMIE